MNYGHNWEENEEKLFIRHREQGAYWWGGGYRAVNSFIHTVSLQCEDGESPGIHHAALHTSVTAVFICLRRSGWLISALPKRSSQLVVSTTLGHHLKIAIRFVKKSWLGLIKKIQSGTWVSWYCLYFQDFINLYMCMWWRRTGWLEKSECVCGSMLSPVEHITLLLWMFIIMWISDKRLILSGI